MDFSKYTTQELYKIYHALGWELVRRNWWIYLLIFLGVVSFYIAIIIIAKTDGKKGKRR